MQIGIIGLGRMGGNIARRLMKAGHQCVVFDADPKAVSKLGEDGAKGAGSLEELVKALDKPRAVWSMLPAGKITEDTITKLGELLEAEDVVIDGGNSFYKDDIRRAKTLAEKTIHYIDCGTSRRHLGDRPGLLHDDRRREGGGGPARPDLLRPGAGPG